MRIPQAMAAAGTRRADLVLPDLHPLQLEVALSPARFKIVCAGRRWRKTSLGVLLALKRAYEGGHVFWVAPTFKLAGIGWRMATAFSEQIPGIVVRQSTMTLQCRHGCGWLTVKSAEAGDCRGEGLDLAVIDEAAHLPDADVWLQQLRPSLADRQGGAVFITTPRGNNWFRDLYDYAMTDAAKADGWATWRFPSSSNPAVQPEEIERNRRELPSWIFAQEYLAEFTVPGGGLFKLAQFKRWREESPGFATLEDRRYEFSRLTRFATVDLAASTKTTADYTVIQSWAVTDQSDLILLDQHRERLEGPDILPAIQNAVARHRLDFVAIERVGFQLALVQQAQRSGLPVRELTADRDKVSRAIPASVYAAQGRLWLPVAAPWLRDLEREIEAFPETEHDDAVDALAYAVSVVHEGLVGWQATAGEPPRRKATPLSDLASGPRPW